MNKTKVLFFGNEQLAQGIRAKTPIFDAIVADGRYKVCAVVLPQAHVRKPFPITIAAQKHNIEICQVQKGAELLSIIEEFRPEIGVLAAFGKLVNAAVRSRLIADLVGILPLTVVGEVARRQLRLLYRDGFSGSEGVTEVRLAAVFQIKA